VAVSSWSFSTLVCVFCDVLIGGLPVQFQFEVPLKLSKPQIKTYLEELYNVRITAVDTAIVRGKIKNSNMGKFKRSDYKKAFVMVADPLLTDVAAAASAVVASSTPPAAAQ
jgi:large subunit ribosomal protein L23